MLAQEPDPPPPALPPPPPPLVRTTPDDSAYPQNLLHVVELIEEGYVRPIARVDLLAAALGGLYEVTGESVPPNLRVQAEKAIRAKSELRLLEQARKQVALARLNDEEALLASCRAMVRILDPYCEVLVGDEARRISGRMDNFGVGLDLDDSSNAAGIRIKDVFPGSPAQIAGLRPDDRITAIDGKIVDGMPLHTASLRLNRGSDFPAYIGLGETAHLHQSEPNSKVVVRIQRAGVAELRTISLERRQFHVETVFGVRRRDDNSWDYWIDRDRKIAQVRLGALREDTADDLRQGLTRLREAGMRGLLLDLRWCPGGLVDQSVESAKLFLEKCTICKANGRSRRFEARAGEEPAEKAAGNPEVSRTYASDEPGPFRALHILVLVNADTSGGGELIAAALQDHERAVVAGQRTRGKASIQIMDALPARGAYLKLTSGEFVRSSGQKLHRFPDSKPSDEWGVRPNHGLEYRISAGMNRQLREWWAAQTLRPGGSRERLPLDDPDADPQRQLALQALRERIR